MFESKAYKTYYAFASGEKTPKPKYVRKKADSDTSPNQKPVQATKCIRLKTKTKVAKFDSMKKLAKKPKAKGLVVLSEVALTKAEQLKLATKRSKTHFHSSHASGSGDGVYTQSKVTDEQHLNTTDAAEGTEDENDESDYIDKSDGDDNDDGSSDDHDDDSDDERTKFDRDEILGPSLTNVNQTEQEEDVYERVHTPSDYELTDDENIHDEENIDEEEEDEVTKELYDDVNTTTSLPSLPDFASVFKFNERVTNLETDMSEIKQVDKEEAQAEKREYIELVDSMMRKIIKEKVNSQLPQILPQAISDVVTPVIEKNVTESLEVAVLTRGVETIKTKIKTPPLDQTEGQKEGNQVKMLSLPEIQGQRNRSLQAPLKTPLNLNISLSASLPMPRSQVILLKTQACNKINSSSWETKMNNSLKMRLQRLTSSRNPSDLQLLILIGLRDNKLTFDLLRPGLVKLHMLKNLLLHLMSSMIPYLISLHLS
nr:hypothetical protein [Tanacetum cinerariifolium]